MLPEETEEFRPVWNYTDLLLVIGWIAAPILILLLFKSPAGAKVEVQQVTQALALLAIIAQIIFYGWVYLALYLVIQIRHKIPVLRALQWRRSRFNLLLAFGGGLLLAVIIACIATLLHTPEVKSPLAGLTDSPLTLALVSLLAITLAPFFEELIFRGFLQPLLSRTFGAAVGILLTAILFGGLHAPEYSYAWQYAVAISLVGAVLGWVRHSSGSLIPSTVVHGAFNTFAVIGLAAKYLPKK